ncbi:MAG: hypothetical protein LBF68_01015 [Christensenellaceae bacterium]|jgi:hypothetical protein|nr:hypothetical protein [Christensenellaceae bacterium]
MSKLFNTIFENSLRVLLLLSITPKTSKNVDMISALDFIAIYNKTLGIGGQDLHGENPFAFSEYTTRREIISEAIKELVLRSLVSIEHCDSGFCYTITQNGKQAIQSIDNDYADEYLVAVSNAISFAKNKNEQQLIAFINQKATGNKGVKNE